jgi:hypothetical protein
VNPRFELALERLRPTDWARFEKLSSEFLAPEWPNLRTVASASGDQGRDAELFSPHDHPHIIIQYSVAKNWKSKITRTAETAQANLPNARVLVYLTNQEVGARSDEIKSIIGSKYHLYLDVRDKSWFLERADIDPYRGELAEQLSREITDSYLAARRVIPGAAHALSSLEAKSALVYLGMQWEDDIREKGLTRLCFEALVKAALRDTTAENRLSTSDIRQRVRSYLPNHPESELNKYVDSALTRMRRHAITFSAPDLFALSFTEREKLVARLAQFEVHTNKLTEEIAEYTARRREGMDGAAIEADAELRIRRVLEKFLLRNGELFAEAVVSGEFNAIPLEELRAILLSDAEEHPIATEFLHTYDLVQATIEDILISPTSGVRQSLRPLADAYTLMAFLRETPDVQGAVVKMFSQGDIWLDTTAALPLFTEDLRLDETEKFLTLTRGAREAGLRLHITAGVLQEIERHFNRCFAYARNPVGWRGRVPFLCMAHALSGRPRAGFGPWAERFLGDSRPEDDIATFLADEFGIDVEDLEDDARRADSDLRYAAEDAWRAVHDKRRAGEHQEFDELARLRLVAHDVENSIGILARRGNEIRPSAFGYTNWCLTLDRSAPLIYQTLRRDFPDLVKASPFISPDFLLNYLTFGPVRRQVSKRTEAAFPVALDQMLFPVLPAELVETAEQVRSENAGLAENVIRRRVRDSLDKARARLGPIASQGLDDVERAWAAMRH